MKTRDRIEALRDLIELRIQLPEAILRVKQFSWDSKVELIVLTRIDAQRLLGEYLEGKLSADSVEEWANAVEGREDIGLETGSQALLKNFVFELANPYITHQLTPLLAIEWMRRLA